MTDHKSAPDLPRLDAASIEAELSEYDAATLAGLIRRANREYWDEHAATLPDPLYDRLVEALRRLDPGAAVLDELGPTPTEGPVLGSGEALEIPPEQRLGASVRHLRPMLSLDKCYSGEALLSWAEKFEGEIVVMPKMDGIACSLRYRAGRLHLAATRGSGTEGEDITINVLDIEDVPIEIETVTDLEVRGELYMRRSVFARYAKKYSNPRNLTAGAVKHKDRGRTRDYSLSFYPYDIEGPALEDEREKFAHLEAIGFATAGVVFAERAELVGVYEDIGRRRDELDYEIDGVVYRAASVREQRRMGSTAHHPRWSIAFKFQGDTGESVLRAVSWSVSRTGTITPIALFDPIGLSGAMISRASLHNLNIFEGLRLTHGATIQVTRRGGVIPNVERVVSPGPGERSFPLPNRCPACAGPVERRKKREGEFLYCKAPEACISARLGSLAHFAKVVDIQGFGPKIIAQCVGRGLLSGPADYYRLRLEDLETFERLGRRSAQNLIDQIESRRSLELPTFLQALGIDHLGRQNAIVLSNAFGGLDRIRALDRDAIMEVKGFKDAIADALVAGLAEHETLIEDLLSHIELHPYSVPETGADAAAEGPLAGKRVLFTGTLENLGRKDAQGLVTEHGGIAATSVNKELDVLVIGAGRGAKSSKQKKAETLIEIGAELSIIGELEFLAIVGASPE
jgi:DNA ligase (NAD+)